MKTTGELASLGNLIERVRVAMVTTAEPTGMLRSCPLLTLTSDDEDRRLWFFVSSTSDADWMHRGHRRVGIAYADPNKQDYASLSGSAAIVRDPEKMGAPTGMHGSSSGFRSGSTIRISRCCASTSSKPNTGRRRACLLDVFTGT